MLNILLSENLWGDYPGTIALNYKRLTVRCGTDWKNAVSNDGTVGRTNETPRLNRPSRYTRGNDRSLGHKFGR